jgi:hypothetical protein
MEQQSGEERGFQALLEQVRAEVGVMADGLAGLEERLNRRFQALEHKTDSHYQDIRTGIKSILDRLEAHERAHTT